ncbi:hypothetical protein [Mycolicibacterium llatzerense]|uniref:Uncharacterized protein n=1 Tax=Mycolicibacterium llatzerense TaxID=280871 RepID=A0A0D1LFI1_9MYCO|nr:hypothetical protein [Mycolicibacterium llatzerense]KIU14756.1 hypothetical protein TL10_22455 [Mycolicibacterium llatzerense]MCT7371259.1 hypothetical protein [Mycolicibacterium llatzerense]
MPDDYHDNLADLSRLAREMGQGIAATRRNVIPDNGRVFWKLTDADSGALAWLAFTRPDARSTLGRRKVWTLIPQRQVFMANWFVIVDRERTDQSQWSHTIVDIDEARELALLVSRPSAEDMKRITRPAVVLTLDDIDKHAVAKVLGKGTAMALKGRR